MQPHLEHLMVWVRPALSVWCTSEGLVRAWSGMSALRWQRVPCTHPTSMVSVLCVGEQCHAFIKQSLHERCLTCIYQASPTVIHFRKRSGSRSPFACLRLHIGDAAMQGTGCKRLCTTCGVEHASAAVLHARTAVQRFQPSPPFQRLS